MGGSCKKDSRYVCAKGQVLYASALTVKSHLRQNKAEWVNAKGSKTPHLEQKRQEGDTNGNSGVCLRLYKSKKEKAVFLLADSCLITIKAERHVEDKQT